MKRIFFYFAILIFVFCVSTILTGYVAEGGKKLGSVITSVFWELINVPDNLREIYRENNTLPDYLKIADEPAINHLKTDVFALHTFQRTNKVILINLRNNIIIHEWNIGNVKKAAGTRYYAIMLSHRNIIVYTSEDQYLARLDSDSKVIWKNVNQFQFHHSINFDADSNIWICGRDIKYLYDYEYIRNPLDTGYFNEDYSHLFIDEYLLCFDSKNGSLRYKKSLYDLFTENNINPFLSSYGYSGLTGDIFHLNDIEPIIKTTKYFTKGDLLISFRNQNLVILYSPLSGKIIQSWSKGFHRQHDVDLYNDSTLSVFNNNSPNDETDLILYKSRNKNTGHINSNIILFDYNGKRIPTPGMDSIFEENNIYSMEEGLVEYLPDGKIFVEEQSKFNLWIIQDNKVIYRGYFNAFAGKGYKEIPNWTKVYENINF